MATHSSVLAQRIPGTAEPGGLPSMGRTESDTTEATQQQQQQQQVTTITQCGDIRCVTKLLNLFVFISSTHKCLEQYSPQITEIHVNNSESEGHWVNIKWVPYCSHQPTGSKASILQHSSFLIIQLSHPYMTTVKTITWTRRIFLGKVMQITSCEMLHWVKHKLESRLQKKYQ